MIKGIIRRIKSDYFIGNRINFYEEIIRKAIENGYEIVSHSKFYKMVRDNEIKGKKILMIRHDIDTDPLFCNQWLAVEKKYGVQTSYFFRLSTVDIPVMKKVIEQGSDCGYHYEELATYAKKHNIKSADEIKKHFEAIRSIFKVNLNNLEKKLGHKITAIASHGDFANRKIGVMNHEFITDDFLKTVGVEFETYQKEFLDNLSIYISDYNYPVFYKGEVSQIDAIGKYPIIHLLVHPRHWRTSVKWNTRENLVRLIEGLKYK